MVTAAVEIFDLHKDFPTSFRRDVHAAVRGVSLRVMPGEVYGLIGPNGSGKSTTMKAVLGLLAPTRGHCSIFGHDSLRVDSRQQTGFLPENSYFYRHLTGRETLRFYGKLCGLSGKTLEARVEELLELTSLKEAENRRLAGYSRGMLQRIGLAQAMVQNPKLLVLDEPTAGVDPIGSRMIRDLIFELKNQGVTIFLCSHLLEQVQEVCDRVGMIYRGKMICEGELDALLSVQNQTEIVIENATPELLACLEQKISETERASVVYQGKPKATLEQIFLDKIRENEANFSGEF